MDELSQLLDNPDAVPAGAARTLPDPALTALVSKRVLRGDPVLFVYRDQDDETDSGWTLLAGDEPDSWLEDPERFESRTIAWILEKDPSLGHVLGSPVDSAWERDAVDEHWVELEEDNEE